MLSGIAKPLTDDERGRRNVPYFAGVALLCLVYAGLVFPSGIMQSSGPLPGWLGVVIALAPLFYAGVVWVNRNQLIRLDYHMLYLPYAIWLAASISYKFAVWELTGGRPFWHSYGADKGMASALVETLLVFTFGGIYLLRFRLKHLNPAEAPERLAFRLCAVVAIITCAIALLMPPLPD